MMPIHTANNNEDDKVPLSQITDITNEDIEYCNKFLAFEYHIGGKDIATDEKKAFVGTEHWKRGQYINANTKQVDEDGMEQLYEELTLPRYRVLASLNDRL